MACILLWSSAASMQEDRCDKRAHQLYLATERNTPVILNWFQPCQCCCCLRYPGEYLRLGTLNSYNWAGVLEACDSLKLLSLYFDLCLCWCHWCCHQLGLLGTDLHAVGCGGHFRDTQLFFSSPSSSAVKPSMSSAKRRLVIALPPMWIVVRY